MYVNIQDNQIIRFLITVQIRGISGGCEGFIG